MGVTFVGQHKALLKCCVVTLFLVLFPGRSPCHDDHVEQPTAELVQFCKGVGFMAKCELIFAYRSPQLYVQNYVVTDIIHPPTSEIVYICSIFIQVRRSLEAVHR